MKLVLLPGSQPAAGSRIELPTRLRESIAGRYTIERELGRGGIAYVYLAHDLRHNRKVAIKALRPELSAALGAERFLHEITLTARLSHPGIVPIFDSGAVGDLLYYVMPFVPGESLRARLEREGQLPLEDAVTIAGAVAAALDYAHGQGVVHRDIKPENILLHDGVALVADFGIARVIAEGDVKALTSTGVAIGTPHYMSPEQATAERVIDGRSDVFSLGCVVYEMLIGEPPFRGPTSQVIAARRALEPMPAICAVRPAVPLAVETTVRKALAKIPADRYSSASAFSSSLASAAKESVMTQAGAQESSKLSAVATPRRPAVVRSFWLYALAAFAVVATASAVWEWLRPEPSRPILRYTWSLDSAEAMTARPQWNPIALSPDGKRLAYASGGDARLLVRSRDQLHGVAVAGTEGASAPFFSPDGKQVGFFVGKRLKLASLSGGPPVTVVDSLDGLGEASWGRDGFVYVGGPNQYGLIRIAAKPGAVAWVVTTLDTTAGESLHVWPDALPRGGGVLFTIAYGPKGRLKFGAEAAIAVADLATGKYRILVNDAYYPRYVQPGYLLYVSHGTLTVRPFDERSLTLTGEPRPLNDRTAFSGSGSPKLAVSSNGTLVYVPANASYGLSELVWVTRNGKAESVDSAWRGHFDTPAIAPDGSRIAVAKTAQSSENEIWIKQLDGGQRSRLTVDRWGGIYPTWTPDGLSVTYSSARSGSEDLWTKRADGSVDETLQLHEKKWLVSGVWSPKGDWLIFEQRGSAPGEEEDILAIQPGSSRPAVPLAATKAEETAPAISPDGRWLAYVSDETGDRQVYVVPFPNANAAKWMISTTGGTEPVWSHHSGELFYRDGAGRMVAVQVRTAASFSSAGSTPLFSASRFATGAIHAQYAVAPDDQRFLMIRPLEATASDRLVVVENWIEELNAKSRAP